MKKQEVMAALNSLLEDIMLVTNESCEDEIRTWLMAATLRIWSGNKFFTQDYVTILSVFKNEVYSAAQVITALDCASEVPREMDVPVFFVTSFLKTKQTTPAIAVRSLIPSEGFSFFRHYSMVISQLKKLICYVISAIFSLVTATTTV